MRRERIILGVFLLLITNLVGATLCMALEPIEQLGKKIFFDEYLSIYSNQSCASCHDSESGWTGPLAAINIAGAVYEGSIQGRFGNRKPPSVAYATQSPIFHLTKELLFVGGNFWDGRATGERLGNPSADQAQGPFLNPVEQALDAPPDVVEAVCIASYGALFREVWGPEICEPGNVYEAYDDIALSIAAYEASTEVNSFTSKFDFARQGKAKLTKEEQQGFALFMGKGKCNKCHIATGKMPLFTDFTYDNVGVPKNLDNPWYTMPPEFNPDGTYWVDEGLGGFLNSHLGYQDYASENMGKHKVPTLRNVDKRPDDGFVKAFGHNGYFKNLEEIVHFYNTRDTLGSCESNSQPEPGMNCWPEPELSDNINTSELGDLGLTEKEEENIVAFLRTLSDGYVP